MSSDKKRKRDSNHAPRKIKVTTAPPVEFPPILATTHGITLPPAQSFTAYTRPFEPPTSRPSKSSSKRPRSEEYLLHGPTPRIDYEGREFDEDSEYHRYYVGIYDPATNSVELHVAPKVHVSRVIKAHRKRDSVLEDKGMELNYADSRAALGKQFGTKKAQKALISREMNKIDVSDMGKSVTTSLLAQVEENTKDMPTTQQLGVALMENRPIPPVNKEATKPEDVYSLFDIISEEEWGRIWIKDWDNGEDIKTESNYVRSRARRLLSDKKIKNTKSLKILKYISWMIDFNLYQQKGRGRLQPMERVKKTLHLDQILVEGFFRRYAEKTANGEGKNDAYNVSPANANKLLYHMAVLCLMADHYDVDIFELKGDLGMQPKELIMAFKEVGCQVKDLTLIQYTAMKMTKAEAVQHKRAILKIPLEFPPPPRRRTTGRR